MRGRNGWDVDKRRYARLSYPFDSLSCDLLGWYAANVNVIVVACIHNQKSRGKGAAKPTSKRAAPSFEGKSVREERSGEGKRMRKVVTFDNH